MINERWSAAILTNRTLSIENRTDKVPDYDLAIRDHVVLYGLCTGRQKNKGHTLHKRGLKPPSECGCGCKKIKTNTRHCWSIVTNRLLQSDIKELHKATTNAMQWTRSSDMVIWKRPAEFVHTLSLRRAPVNIFLSY